MILFHAELFVQDNVGTEEERKEFVQHCLNMKETNLNNAENYSNDGCWRKHLSPSDTPQWLQDNILKLSKQVVDAYRNQDRFKKEFNGLKPTDEIDFNYSPWLNINEPKSKNVMHSHEKSSISGIYYLQSEGTGALRFHNPANTLVQCNHTSPSVSSLDINPIDGYLLIWPSWVPHEVLVNESDKQRINIAFNIELN